MRHCERIFPVDTSTSRQWTFPSRDKAKSSLLSLAQAMDRIELDWYVDEEAAILTVVDE
jgi:hypothetical protein